jgi:predicted dehydrogenase
LLVGCGGISRTWLRAVADIPDVQIVGMVDLVEDAARARADEFGLRPEICNDVGTMLTRLSPDVVFNCTIPEAHRDVALCALAAGCHVLGEKPLADSMAHAREMIAAARSANRILAVIQNRRYDARTRRVRALVQSAALGPLTTAHCDFFLGAHFGGFRDHMAHVLLLDMAIHTFDMARCITGCDPLSVYCQEWNPAGSWYDRDASALAVFEMTDDVMYTYRGSWCSEGMHTSWEGDWRFVGLKGSLRWDGADALAAEQVVAPGGLISELAPFSVPEFDAGAKVGGHAGVIREFLGCVRRGGVPETDASDNIKSLAMVFGAIESAQAGRRVAISF